MSNLIIHTVAECWSFLLVISDFYIWLLVDCGNVLVNVLVVLDTFLSSSDLLLTVYCGYLNSKSCPETRRVVSASLLYSMSCHHPVWCFFIVESNGFWDLYFLQLVSQRMVATLSLVCFSLFRQIEYVLWFDRGPIRFTRQSFTEQVAITTHYQPRHRGRHQVLPFGEFQISFKFFNILKEPMFSNWHAQLNKITTITSSKRMLMMHAQKSEGLLYLASKYQPNTWNRHLLRKWNECLFWFKHATLIYIKVQSLFCIIKFRNYECSYANDLDNECHIYVLTFNKLAKIIKYQ